MTGRAPALTAAELELPVRRALEEPDARVCTWDIAPVAYDRRDFAVPRGMPR